MRDAAAVAAGRDTREPLSPGTGFAPLAASLALAAAARRARRRGRDRGAAARQACRRRQPAAAVAADDNARAAGRRVAQAHRRTRRAQVRHRDRNKRSTTAQLGKLTERLDRTEKAQAEPAAKLAKIMPRALDRLERRTAAAALAAGRTSPARSPPSKSRRRSRRSSKAGGCATSTPAAPWSRAATARCSRSVPVRTCRALGRVETIKREDGTVVVTTPKGIIAASLDPPRRPDFLPQRY